MQIINIQANIQMFSSLNHFSLLGIISSIQTSDRTVFCDGPIGHGIIIHLVGDHTTSGEYPGCWGHRGECDRD